MQNIAEFTSFISCIPLFVSAWWKFWPFNFLLQLHLGFSRQLFDSGVHIITMLPPGLSHKIHPVSAVIE